MLSCGLIREFLPKLITCQVASFSCDCVCVCVCVCVYVCVILYCVGHNYVQLLAVK